MGIDQIKYSSTEAVSTSTPETPKDFKATFNEVISDGKVTKEELDALLTRFDAEKKDINSETGKELSKLRIEATTNMLKNGFDIRNARDIDNLNRFILGTDIKLDKILQTKLDTIKAFYDKADKTMLENARDFIGYDNITLTLNDKNEIVEMGVLDFNNPLNDNEAEIKKEDYNIDRAIDEDKALDSTKNEKISENTENQQQSTETQVSTQKVELKKDDIPGTINSTKEFLNKNKSGLKKFGELLKDNGFKDNLIKLLDNAGIKLSNPTNVQVREGIKTLQAQLNNKQDGAFGPDTLKAYEKKYSNSSETK